MKSSRKLARKPETAQDILAITPDFEMMCALDNMVRASDGADYREMPELGRMITTLFAIDIVSDAEGLPHFILHSGDRLSDAKTFLGVIGAEKKAAILNRVEDMFPGGTIPESESKRWEVMFGSGESEDEGDMILDGISKSWHLADEDVPHLVRLYLEDRRAELDELIASRAVKRAGVGKYAPLADEDITRLAYAGDAQSFVGHEFELVDVERLPLLMQLVGDSACALRSKLFRALYGISGSIAAEALSGRQPRALARIQAAINEASASADGQMREWATRSQVLLADPDPLLTMAWMEDAIAPYS